MKYLDVGEAPMTGVWNLHDERLYYMRVSEKVHQVQQ